jgi:ribosomal protein L7/L12
MEGYIWVIFSAFGVLALMQLASTLAGILRSLQSTEAMMKRFLAHQGIHWEAAVEPSEKVKELALKPGSTVAAIKAYREQTGVGLKEAKAVVEELSRSKPGAA